MRQKIPPPSLRSPFAGSTPARSPFARAQPEPETPPEPPRPSRLQRWRERAIKWRARSRSILLVGAGMLIALAALFTYDALRPADTRLTKRDVEAVVARAMASATPPPSYASRVYEIIAPSIVQVRTKTLTTAGKTESGSGSGVILDEGGAILTSLHVVTGSLEIQVIFYDNTEAEASIIAASPENDIAVLRARGLPAQVIPATLGSPGALNVGDEAFVVGNPFGIRHSLTAGVISGLGRNFKSPRTGRVLSNLIQFDAAVNPGNSGGPLLNRDGEVVGIVTSLFNPTDQDVFIGIGFAVPIETAAGAAGSPPY